MSDSLIDLAWLVYFIEVLATEKYNGFAIVSTLLGITGYTLLIIIPENDWFEGVPAKLTKVCNVCLIYSLVYFIYYNVIPSKETAWQITGIVMAAKVAENPEIQKLSGEGINILEKKLKLYSKELDKKLGIEAMDKGINND